MSESEIFAAATRLSGEARREFVRQACGSNDELRRDIEALLSAHDQSFGIVPEVPERVPISTRIMPEQVEPGTIIAGRYKLLEPIGEGGMGSVWLAEQKEPVKRKVALKLIKPGMDSRAVLARFEAERQALAVMDHPNIAKVYDGGMTSEGRPYFVMELVRGIPLTDYCDQVQLSVSERLELFAQVCSAVQHAHQKGIIHRDLKPSNILVTEHDGKPICKVIDFGLAKAMHGAHALTDASLHTAFGSVVGTPLYMAPEQLGVSALDIDTRADLYSLGVILYELLTGSTPIEKQRLKQAALDEILRIVREEEPPIPSQRLSSSDTLPSVAARRHTEPGRLTRLVRGDLDWIIMRALEKDRNRRYETANGLASDIQRYLAGEAVLAAPPSSAYRLRKFVLRNKGLVIASSLVMAALLAGLAATIWQMNRAIAAEVTARKNEQIAQKSNLEAIAERDLKERERKYAQAISDFVLDDILAFTSIDGQIRSQGYDAPILGRDTTLRTLLNRAADKLEFRRDLDPVTEVNLRLMVGSNLSYIGDFSQAIETLSPCLKLLAAIPDSAEELSSRTFDNLAMAYSRAGQPAKAMDLHREVLRQRTERTGPDSYGSLLAEWWLLQDRVDLDVHTVPLADVEQLERRMSRALEANAPETLNLRHLLAELFAQLGQYARAKEILETNVVRQEEQLGPGHPGTLTGKCALIRALREQGEIGAATQLVKQVATHAEKIWQEDDPQALVVLQLIGTELILNGDPRIAIEHSQRLLELESARSGPSSYTACVARHQLAIACRLAADYARAMALFAENGDWYAQAVSRFPSYSLAARLDIALTHQGQGEFEKAAQMLNELETEARTRLGSQSQVLCKIRFAQCVLLREQGRYQDARKQLERTLPQMVSVLGPRHSDTLQAQYSLADTLIQLGHSAEGLELLRSTHALEIEVFGAEHPYALTSSMDIAQILADNGEIDNASQVFDEQLPKLTAILGPDHKEVLRFRNNAAHFHYLRRDYERAIAEYELVVQSYERVYGRKHILTQVPIVNLAINYTAHGELEKSTPLLQEAFVTIPESHGSWEWCGLQLVDAYRRGKRLPEAVDVAEKLLEAARQRKVSEIELSGMLAVAGDAQLEAGDCAKAESLLQDCLAIRKRKMPDEWRTYNTMSLLGQCLMMQGRMEEAESLLEAGGAGVLSRLPAPTPEEAQRVNSAVDRLIEFHTRQGNSKRAEYWKARRIPGSPMPNPDGGH